MPKSNPGMPLEENSGQFLPAANTQNKANEPSKVVALGASVMNAAREGFKAANATGFSFFYGIKSVSFGLQAGFAAVKAVGNLGMLVVDTSRAFVNTLYYHDKEATEAAKKDGEADFDSFSLEINAVSDKTIKMVSTAHDATLSILTALECTQNSLRFATEAREKSIELALEGGAIVYQAAKDAYDMLPAYNKSIAQPNRVEIEMATLPRGVERLLISASAAAAA